MSPSAKIISNSENKITLLKTQYESLIKQVPTVVNRILELEITSANCAVVNAIRRTIMAEMPVKHLTVALTDIKSTDPYIIGEAIRKRVEMIPISQSTNLDSVFSLRVENNSNTYADVLSTEIKLNGSSISKDIHPMIPICDINSNKSISISDIHVIESYGYDNSRVSIGRIAYEILDADFNVSSVNSDPSKFRLEVETPGVIDPLQVVIQGIDNLIDRIDAIDYEHSITEFDIFKLTILNETYSIGQLMSYYIYKEEPIIKYVANRIKHPSQRECIIDVHHPSGKELCKKAAAKIKTDLQSIRKTLK